MMIKISDEYAHDILIVKLQEDFLEISSDIEMIETMNDLGETQISTAKFHVVRDSIMNVLKYHMEEEDFLDFFSEYEDMKSWI